MRAIVLYGGKHRVIPPLTATLLLDLTLMAGSSSQMIFVCWMNRKLNLEAIVGLLTNIIPAAFPLTWIKAKWRTMLIQKLHLLRFMACQSFAKLPRCISRDQITSDSSHGALQLSRPGADDLRECTRIPTTPTILHCHRRLDQNLPDHRWLRHIGDLSTREPDACPLALTPTLRP